MSSAWASAPSARVHRWTLTHHADAASFSYEAQNLGKKFPGNALDRPRLATR